jgi:hypothetical protein
MELFIPSVLVLLLAAAIVFFVLPRFGAPVLAIISVALLVYGIYTHMNAFGTEYRFSTWQLGLMSYAPYIMIGGLLVVIAFYLISISPLGKPNGATAPSMPEVPTVSEMPPANTATNAVTEGVNNALKGLTNIVGLANTNKKNMGVGNGLANTATKVTNNAIQAVNQAGNALKNTVGKAVSNVTNLVTGNVNKPNSNVNKGAKVPGLNFALSNL